MAATGGATVTPAQVIGLRKNDQAMLEIKLAGQRGRSRRCCVDTMERHHAVAADAGNFLQSRWNLRQQSVRDIRLGAPTGAVIRRVSAELAIVGAPAQRTTTGIGRVCFSCVHGLLQGVD